MSISSNISVSDSQLKAALAQASTPAIMMSLVQMHGNIDVLDGLPKPSTPAMLEVQGGFDAEQQAQIRDKAFVVAKQFFAVGKAPTVPKAETLRLLMGLLLGEAAISNEHQQILFEELALDGVDKRRIDIDQTNSGQLDAESPVVIAGAGLSGLLLAIRLKQQNIPFVIYEKNSGVGGTWYENTYPGCRVDIASHNYSLSFDMGEWSGLFCTHDELRQYFERLAHDYDLYSHIVFNAHVESATYQESDRRWQVDVELEGKKKRIPALAFVSAVGQLNQAKIPSIDGIESFCGEHMHTAKWDHSVELKGKKIAVIGSGASAFQLVPQLAKLASELSVFQRTPQWMFPNPIYHHAVGDDHQWCFRHLPGYARWYRILSLWPMLDKASACIQVDEGWDDGGLSCGVANKMNREGLEAYITSQVSDPELLNKVVPQYPPFGTRTLQDNGGWLHTLQQDHVRLVSSGLKKINGNTLHADNHETVEVDVIIWATGFHADRFVWPIEICGRNSVNLDQAWAKSPSAYLGITVPQFPNLFCLYGPNTNVAHTANVVMIAECQVAHIMQVLKAEIEGGVQLEITCDAALEYDKKLQSRLDKSVWGYRGVRSFYQNPAGKVVVNMPWDAAEYWAWTVGGDLSGYVVN